MSQEPTEQDLKIALRVVMATPTKNLPDLLESNKDKHKSIIELIEAEMELREEGVRRIPTIEEARMLFGAEME